MVAVAPTPTHTAYAVPTGRDFMAHARPPMEIAQEMRKTRLGMRRVKPAERSRAMAHTASKAPERTRISQGMVMLSGRLVIVPGTAPSSGPARWAGLRLDINSRRARFQVSKSFSKIALTGAGLGVL